MVQWGVGAPSFCWLYRSMPVNVQQLTFLNAEEDGISFTLPGQSRGRSWGERGSVASSRKVNSHDEEWWNVRKALWPGTLLHVGLALWFSTTHCTVVQSSVAHTSLKRIKDKLSEYSILPTFNGHVSSPYMYPRRRRFLSNTFNLNLNDFVEEKERLSEKKYYHWAFREAVGYGQFLLNKGIHPRRYFEPSVQWCE